ncbi:PepSY-associated TM helix domain-containing protein [Corynebacterium pelargi]|uniref:Uncharacterized protein n=1 Tax=Corynebacterium pelargi TaxID=1471400 RepID=A0A410W9X3_9CORY|nr:PepSY domain-containing protein [Corynebacterium pelargi]QAU52754.1 hypothetical protein CPELA_07470 [Corynebacterium pelargi]GGG78566.1 membrane protein [Corynebacterium pelargi]
MTLSLKHEPREQRKSPALRPIVVRMHTVAGILIAPLIVVAALSGLFYALCPTLEQWVYHDEITTTVPADAQALDVQQQVQAAKAVAGDRTLAGVQLYDDPEKNTRVLFADPKLGEGVFHAVFVDPYNAEIKGQLEQYGKSSALPLTRWASYGHKNLWLGTPGRIYSELAASWLGFFAISGVVLWWQLQGKDTSKFKAMLRWSQAKGSGRRLQYLRQHGVVGTVLAAGLIFLCVTGLTWSLVAGDNIAKLRKELGWTSPSTQASVSKTITIDDPIADIDAVAATTRQELRLPVRLMLPETPEQGWVATELRQPYRMATDAVAIDSQGDVISFNHFDSWPLAAKATVWLIQLHMGTLFGLPNQLALVALALGITFLVIRGYQIWYRRGFGNAPRVRSLRPLATKKGALLLAALAAYSVIAPLFGLSILVLFALDWGLSKMRGAITFKEEN